jgi:hypothetical protein
MIIGVMLRYDATVERPSSRGTGSGAPERSPRRVAVVFEPGRGGVAVLEHAARLVAERPTELTVLALAPQGTPPRCGRPFPGCVQLRSD